MVQPMKVLLCGNNPNIQFYTSRFQTFPNIELFHVSDIKSNNFQMETLNYGTVQYSLDNHFTSLKNLVEALKHMSHDIRFDLIILSAHSLQELNSIPDILKSVIDKQKTTILIESSGVLPIETFINNNSTFSNVFSILSSYDIRECDSNNYKQFDTSIKNTITLGQSSYSDVKTKKLTSSSLSKKYNESVLINLKNLTNIFNKIFEKESVSACDYHPSKFLSEQWSLAIQTICLDPLMVLFQQTDIKTFLNEILAKPLISGLVTEILTLAKANNAKLSSNTDNENHIIKSWRSKYESQQNYYPQLVYNFQKRLTSCLNLDLLLLQPILLADDHDIKTPYLEFLYTVMIQFNNINKNESNWFIRNEKLNDLKQSMSQIKLEKQNLFNDYKSLQDDVQENSIQFKNVQARVNSLEMENLQLKQRNERSIMEKDQIINDLKLQIATLQTEKANVTTEINEPIQKVITPPIGDSTMDTNNNTEMDQSLMEKEKELLAREIELKEKELEMKKQFALQQQQLQQQLQQPLYINNNNNNSMVNSPVSPPPNMSPVFARGSIKPQQLPYNHSNLSNGNVSRSNHSTPTLPNASASRFVDPISSGLSPPMDITEGFPTLQSKSSFGSHPIKPTSRKNRKSNMPAIGNASSIGFNDVSTQSNVVNPGGRRISSMPTHGVHGGFNNNNSGMDINRQGLGLDMSQPNRNMTLGMNNHNSNTNIGAMSTPIKNPMTKQSTTKPIQFGSSNPSSSNNVLQFNTSGTSNNNSSSNTPQPPQPIQFGSATPSQSNSSTPVVISHAFGQADASAPTSNVPETTPTETSKDENHKDKKKSKKKFGGLFKRNKK